MVYQIISWDGAVTISCPKLTSLCLFSWKTNILFASTPRKARGTNLRPGVDPHQHEREEHEEGHQVRHGCGFVDCMWRNKREGDHFIVLQNPPVITFIDSYNVSVIRK